MKLETPSLLITDDDRDFRETLRGVFEPRGFRTLLAGDGQEALDIVNRQIDNRQPVHLALLDMHMPRLTGLELIRHVQRSAQPMPCILLSAALDEALEAEARQANAFSVLAKPIRFADLTGIVYDAMQAVYGWNAEK